MKTLLGKKVKIISDNDNYDSFRNEILIITYVAHSTEEHPGYDTSLNDEALCDLKTIDGKDVPFSLYEFEFEII